MGTIFLRNRADLTPVYAMIFRRLHALGADWNYHFPELHLMELGRAENGGYSGCYSVSKGVAETLNTQRRRAEVHRLGKELATVHA